MNSSPTLVKNDPTVLPALHVNALLVHLALLALAAFVLPSLAHLTGLPVRTLLPMHWPVLFAGLCYGRRSGLLLGLFAPFTSFLISGMPPPAMLPAMTLELAAYGFLAGFAREQLRLNTFLSAAIALIGGRVIFIAFVMAVGAVALPFSEYLWTAMLPGVPAAILQMLVLSAVARWWVGRGGVNT